MVEQKLNEIFTVFRSDLGWIGVAFSGDSVTKSTFGHQRRRDALRALRATDAAGTLSRLHRRVVDQMQAFAAGYPEEFRGVLVQLPNLTSFQRDILNRCRRLRWGETTTYGDLAKSAGHPKAARAVGTAMAKNPIPIIIPCHRVVAASGLGGYSAAGGCDTKRRLLEAECDLVSRC